MWSVVAGTGRRGYGRSENGNAMPYSRTIRAVCGLCWPTIGKRSLLVSEDLGFGLGQLLTSTIRLRGQGHSDLRHERQIIS